LGCRYLIFLFRVHCCFKILEKEYEMTNAETHEHYGWLAFSEGFFQEWQDEVAKRILTLNPYESNRESVRADLSVQVYKEISNRKLELRE